MGNETKKISSMRQKTHEGVDNIMDKAENMKESGKEKMAHLKEKAILVKENIDRYIQKKPKRSVLIATGIGAVVGAVITAIFIKRKR